MMILLTIFLLFGFFQQVSLIRCYTCSEAGYYCSLPFAIDGGEEHNENDIPSLEYDSNSVCESDHFIDRSNGQEKLILRGTRHCEPLNVANHRRFCCYSDSCNKVLPPMTRQFEVFSNGQRSFPSIGRIVLWLVCLYICFRY